MFTSISPYRYLMTDYRLPDHQYLHPLFDPEDDLRRYLEPDAQTWREDEREAMKANGFYA